jgi:hypothetical protein
MSSQVRTHDPELMAAAKVCGAAEALKRSTMKQRVPVLPLGSSSGAEGWADQG